MSTPEDAHVARAVDGDGDALEQLLREVGPDVGRGLDIAQRWRASFDREDVMQVTYLEACLRIGSLTSRTQEGFRAWLARIAENNLRDAVRALQRDRRPDGGGRRRATRGARTTAETLLASILGNDPTAGSAAAEAEAAELLQRELRRLPASYRRVVEEVDLAERPVTEVAAELGKSRGAVHMLRARAHYRLAELLGGRRRFFGDSA